MTQLKWKRDGRGRQVSTDGRYAVQSDGYRRGAADEIHFTVGGEWSAILVASDENLEWFPTMREAKQFCELLASPGTPPTGRRT